MSEIKFDRLEAQQIRDELKADCKNCFGLCCTALNIIASSDFPINKPAGTPCVNLQADFSCQIHSSLREEGFKGCTVFDCLGAGQVVSQVTFKGESWRDNPEIGGKMFQVFPIMEQIHEMIAYTAEALSYDISELLSNKLSMQLEELQSLTMLEAEELLSLDLIMYRFSLNELLLETSKHIREELILKLPDSKKVRKYDQKGTDWIGKRFKDKDLRATDFRGSYLIATDLRKANLRGVDFIGADLRDADLSGANLSTSMFLTQMQINSAKGDKETILPAYLKRPSHWCS